MSEFGPQQFGRLIAFAGIILVIIGGLVILLGHLGLFKLPGDLHFEGKGWKIYFPIVTCIILSILLTLILWLINFFSKR